MSSERRDPIRGRGFAGLAALGTSISPEPPLPTVPPFQPTKRVEPIARFTEPAPRAIYEELPPNVVDQGSERSERRFGAGAASLIGVVLWIGAFAVLHMAGDPRPAYQTNYNTALEEISLNADPPSTGRELRPTESTIGGRVYIKSEVLYCLAEDFRLRVLEGAINRRSPSEVRQLTERRADFDRRCLGYRYMPRDLEAATKQVQQQAFELRAQAIQDLAGWR